MHLQYNCTSGSTYNTTVPQAQERRQKRVCKDWLPQVVCYEIVSTRNDTGATPVEGTSTIWLSNEDLNNDNTNRYAIIEGVPIETHSTQRTLGK